MPDLPNRRQELFCRAYVLEPVQVKAAVKAGYSPKQAPRTAVALMKQEYIHARIQELRKPEDEAFKITAEATLKRLHAIATADARDLMQYRVGPCRFCHGIDHAFQWKTEREFNVALAAATAKLGEGKEPPVNDPNWPDLAGGTGYRLTNVPNPDCPECSGLGIPYVTATDTGKLTEAQAMLFNGAKQTQHGIEIAIVDRAKPLEMVAKHLGLAKEQVAVDLSDRLSAGLTDILGRLDAAAPIKRGITP
jgi:hypothetical protein